MSDHRKAEPSGPNDATDANDVASLHSSEVSFELSLHSSNHHENDPEPLHRSLSLERTDTYLASRPETVPVLEYVPKENRRGVLLSWAVIPEAVNPRLYLERTKLTLVLVVAFAAVSGPMGTSILLPAIDDLVDQLHTTTTIANISVGIYLISLGVFPLWWSSLCERIGRRTVYVISFAWFFAFSIGCAVAPNITALIILRLLAGSGASAVQACGAGTIADLYVQEERGRALGLFYLGPLLGPFISPIMGGAVAIKWGWRSTMWIMVIVCGLNVITILLFLPETLQNDFDISQLKKQIAQQVLDVDPNDEKNVDLERMATNLSQSTSFRRLNMLDETPVDALMPAVSRHETNQSAYSKAILQKELSRLESIESGHDSWPTLLYDLFIRPLHSLVLFGYPPVTLAIAFAGISFAGIYFVNIAISTQYSSAPYNFKSIIVGLMYIPNSITYLLASVYGGKWNDSLLKRAAKKNNGILTPESRISWNAVLAICLYPPLCLIFGWCMQKKTFWVFPLIGTALFGLSSMLTIGLVVTYLVDILPGRGSTGIALNNLCRQLLAATATFVTEPLINALGIGVLFSIYVGVFLCASTLMWHLKRNGAKYRETYDLTDFYARL